MNNLKPIDLNTFTKYIDIYLCECGYKIDMFETNPVEKIHTIYRDWQKETECYNFNIESVKEWLEWFKKSDRYVFDLHFSVYGENIVKKTCKILGVTYKELSEMIGVSEGRIKQLAIGEVGEQVQKSCEMLLKINKLEKELSKQSQLKTLLKNFLS